MRLYFALVLTLSALISTPVVAGNVGAALTAGTLRLLGDDDDNRVVLVQATNGDVIVLGFTGTTINNRTAAVFPSATLLEVRMNLAGGSDRMVIGGLNVAGDFSFLGEEGDDIVTQTNAPIFVGGNVVFGFGDGRDALTLDGLTVLGDASFTDTGREFLLFTMFNADFAGNVDVVGTTDGDAIDFLDSTIGGALTVSSPAGGISSGVIACTVGSADFNGGGASSVQFFDSLVTGSVNVTGSDEVDFIDFAITEVQGDVTAQALGGEDLFAAFEFESRGEVVFDGGDGVDTFRDDGITADQGVSLISIEVVQ